MPKLQTTSDPRVTINSIAQGQVKQAPKPQQPMKKAAKIVSKKYNKPC